MTDLNPYLTFNGNCADALRFYERALGAKIEMLLTFGEAPGGEVPPGNEDRVMHAQFTLDGDTVMASDGMAGQEYAGMRGFSLTLTYPTAEEARRAFDALAVGGRVTTPLQQTFWADAWGALTDRFGTPWMVNGGMAGPK